MAARARAGHDDHRQCRRTPREGNRPPRRRRNESPRDGRAGRGNRGRPGDHRRRAAARRHACRASAITASPWPSPSPAFSPKARPSSRDTDCVNTSYPGFYAQLEKIINDPPRAADAGHPGTSTRHLRWLRASPHRHRHRRPRRLRQKQRRPRARPPARLHLREYRRHVPRRDLAGSSRKTCPVLDAGARAAVAALHRHLLRPRRRRIDDSHRWHRSHPHLVARR